MIIYSRSRYLSGRRGGTIRKTREEGTRDAAAFYATRMKCSVSNLKKICRDPEIFDIRVDGQGRPRNTYCWSIETDSGHTLIPSPSPLGSAEILPNRVMQRNIPRSVVVLLWSHDPIIAGIQTLSTGCWYWL